MFYLKLYKLVNANCVTKFFSIKKYLYYYFIKKLLSLRINDLDNAIFD